MRIISAPSIYGWLQSKPLTRISNIGHRNGVGKRVRVCIGTSINICIPQAARSHNGRYVDICRTQCGDKKRGS